MLKVEMFTRVLIPVKPLSEYFATFYSNLQQQLKDLGNDFNECDYQYKAILIIIVTSTVFYVLFKKLCSREKNKSKVQLGKRHIEDIKYLKDIIEETHFAACYCGKNPKLIERCIKLLEMYPEACNIPLHGHNYTPFLRACWNGCTELISYMISIGADTEATTDAGEGGIYLATYRILRNKDNNFDALELLLEAGLNINHSRHDGYTALHLAAARGHSRLATWLLARGADPRPNTTTPPHRLALVYGHKKTAALLKFPDSDSIINYDDFC